MLSVRITRTGVSGIGRRALQEVGRTAVHAAALLWWTRYLAIHFTRAALNRYGYKPREGDPGSGRAFRGSYAESKIRGRKNGQGIRAIGENKPFVWSGASREQALSNPNIQAVARNFQNYEARVLINAPTLNFVPNAREEITATIPLEEQQMEIEFGDHYELELNRRGRTARKTTNIAA